MNKFIIRTVFGLLVGAFMFPIAVNAQTTADQLQQLINSLQAQVLQLQSQLNGVQGTTTSTLDVTVQSGDTSANAGIILAAREEILGNFRFTAAYESATVNSFNVMVNNTSLINPGATSTITADEVPYVRFYDGTTVLGGTNCVVNGVSYTNCWPVSISTGIVAVQNFNWVILANTAKDLRVKGLVDRIGFNGQYADTGAKVYAHIMSQGFQACGASGCDTVISSASGQQKVVYNSKPILSKIAYTGSLQAGSAVPAFKFRVAADPVGEIEFKKVQFYVNMTGATMSGVTVGPAGNTQLDDITSGYPNLNLSTAYSASSVNSHLTAPITGGNSGYVTLELTTPERITAGSYKDYQLKLGFRDLVSASYSACAAIRLTLQETNILNGSPYAVIEGAPVANDGIPSFIWSDRSAFSHSTTTSDWANGRYVRTFDDANAICNGSTNNPPYITNITGPSTLLVNMNGTWTVTATDQEGLWSLTAEWGDNTASSTVWLTGTSTTASVSHRYTTIGTRTIIFRVYDAHGSSDTETITVNVRSLTPDFSKKQIIEGSLIRTAQEQLNEMTAKIYGIMRQLGL